VLGRPVLFAELEPRSDSPNGAYTDHMEVERRDRAFAVSSSERLSSR